MARKVPPGDKTRQDPDRQVGELAARQHGNVTRAQLLGIGMSTKAIHHRLATGRLYPVHRGVYAVGRPPVVPLERAAAAVLACGAHAALSGLSALTLWELRPSWPARPDITVTRGNPRPRDITVHRRTLHRRDVTTQRAIRATSPARTLLDCASLLTEAAVRRAVNDARLAHILRPAALADVVSRNPTHAGARALASLVQGDRGPTRSEFEDRFAALCRRHGLPPPVFGASPRGWETDAYFPEHGLIVELDGWDFHQDRGAFQRDRLRDADHLEHGEPTLRITWERLCETPDREASRLHTILRRLQRR